MNDMGAEQLSKRVEILEKKLSREKKARGLAEKQLEEYSLKIYNTNQSLQKSLLSANKKQSELAYLGNTAAEVSSEHSLEELLNTTIALTSNFLGALYGGHFKSENGVVDTGKVRFWNGKEIEDFPPEKFDDIVNSLPVSEGELIENWTIQQQEEVHSNESYWLLATNFPLMNERIVWIIFLIEQELLDEETLFVLDTARGHLNSGLRRRINDVKILKRTVELQDTVENLERTKKQLVQSEKMASLGQLAAGVAHEINNPVGFIRSNMEMLNDYISDFEDLFNNIEQQICQPNPEINKVLSPLLEQTDIHYLLNDSRELLETNLEGLTRVKEIVDGLKTFSHSGEDELVPVSIVECIESALKVAWNELKYDYTVEQNVKEPLPKVLGILGQLQQVFVNLFVNAAQSMEPGGKLIINGFEQNQRVIIEVIDTGCGMDEKTQNQLFTPFFTTKPVGEGTGLGLSVSYSILEVHNAEIKVESEIGKGTKFLLSFPC